MDLTFQALHLAYPLDLVLFVFMLYLFLFGALLAVIKIGVNCCGFRVVAVLKGQTSPGTHTPTTAPRS